MLGRRAISRETVRGLALSANNSDTLLYAFRVDNDDNTPYGGHQLGNKRSVHKKATDYPLNYVNTPFAEVRPCT